MKKTFIKLTSVLSAAFLLASCTYTAYESSETSLSVSVPVVTETEAPADIETEPYTDVPAEDDTVPETEISETEDTEEYTEDGGDYRDDTYVEYYFRTDALLDKHFEKHGSEFEYDFNFETAEDYEAAASDVINDPDALYKIEAEDGDGVYYLEDTNEFVILSKDGYIRTYFRPDAGIDYFNRQ